MNYDVVSMDGKRYDTYQVPILLVRIHSDLAKKEAQQNVAPLQHLPLPLFVLRFLKQCS